MLFLLHSVPLYLSLSLSLCYKPKCRFSPLLGVKPFCQDAFLQIFWNCVFDLCFVRLLPRVPSSCSSILWSFHHHPLRYPWQKQAGAWGTWWERKGSLFVQHQSNVWLHPSDLEDEDDAGWPTEPLTDRQSSTPQDKESWFKCDFSDAFHTAAAAVFLDDPKISESLVCFSL